MQWIWTGADAHSENIYAEFRQSFSFGGGNVLLDISVSDEYAVFVNGRFADCGQYDDYPEVKFYDTLDLTALCRSGENELLIRAYCQGRESAQCIACAPKLWFRIAAGEWVQESGSQTLCRAYSPYRSGPCEMISPQLAFTFHYDAGLEDQGEWKNALCLPVRAELRPRPIRKLKVFPPEAAAIRTQGVFLADRISVPDTAAKRVYSDLQAPRYPEEFISWEKLPQKEKRYADPALPLPGEYRISTPKGFDGAYVIVDLGRELSGFVHLELEAEPGTVFDVAYGEHLDDGRVRAAVGTRNFAFSYTAGQGRRSFTHWFKRIAGRYLELHARTDTPFTLYHLSLCHTEYPLKEMPRPEGLDALGRKIYDVSVHTLKLCMHEHYEDCPWREQAMYAMDSRNQALAGFYAFREYDYPKACWKLYEPGLRPDGMFPLTVPSVNPKTIPSFTLAWVIACQELVQYGGETYNVFTQTMRKVLDAFAARAKAGILWTLEGAEYWNYFEWADGLSGNNGKEDRPQESAALTLFFYAALRAYDKVCPDGRYEAAAAAVRERFHRTFWDEKAAAYRTFSDTAHYTELVQSLALWCSLVPEELEKDLRGRLADRANPWVKTTLSHYIYKLDALMMEPERYYPEVNRDIMEIWGSMVMEGATSFWETIDGGFAFGRAGSLCHGWSAIPVYFWHKYQAYIADC